uniref:Uncharacterized protein n=1 Tax=Melopsittacus undulatus TaxID=13146 RepID=A0A8V5GWU8_MELUD
MAAPAKSFLSDAGYGEQEQDANSALMEVDKGCWAAWRLSFQKGRMHITVFVKVWIPMIMWKLKLQYLLLPIFLHNQSKMLFLFPVFRITENGNPVSTGIHKPLVVPTM